MPNECPPALTPLLPPNWSTSRCAGSTVRTRQAVTISVAVVVAAAAIGGYGGCDGGGGSAFASTVGAGVAHVVESSR